MNIVDMISSADCWELFLKDKMNKQKLSEKEVSVFRKFIDEQRYLLMLPYFTGETTSGLPSSDETTTNFTALDETTAGLTSSDETASLPFPVRRTINKIGTTKKRVIYSFDEDFNITLKFVAYCLHEYDGIFTKNCLAFKNGSCVRDVLRLVGRHGIMEKYALKLDLSDYFNSIDEELLIERLEFLREKDERLLQFFEKLLRQGKAYENGELAGVHRGAMAGIPVAPFFANVYLSDMDEHFENNGIEYYRYSDDILIFADTESEMERYKKLVEGFVEEHRLRFNEEKRKLSKPGEGFEFLGFAIGVDGIDLSESTKRKIKAKIKRKANALRRWADRKELTGRKAAKGFVKAMNYKFYAIKDSDDFSWSRWFFNGITVDKGLKEIDEYMQQYIRYCFTGRHYKGNYRISYEELKEIGYRPLVHEWYERDS